MLGLPVLLVATGLPFPASVTPETVLSLSAQLGIMSKQRKVLWPLAEPPRTETLL